MFDEIVLLAILICFAIVTGVAIGTVTQLYFPHSFDFAMHINWNNITAILNNGATT